MARLLNIETSTEVCSVALTENGVTRFIKESNEGMNHAEMLTVYIRDLFAENQLSLTSIDAVAVSKGPGSYTGLRIGVSVAKGLCYALDVPLISINSLYILGNYAANSFGKSSPSETGEMLFCPMIDARRMEVFTALYNNKAELIKPVSAEIIDESFLEEFLAAHKIMFFGNGAQKCKHKLTHPNAIFAGPEKTSAQFMQNLAQVKYDRNEFEDVAYFEPFYLKNFVATVPKNKILQ